MAAHGGANDACIAACIVIGGAGAGNLQKQTMAGVRGEIGFG